MSNAKRSRHFLGIIILVAWGFISSTIVDASEIIVHTDKEL